MHWAVKAPKNMQQNADEPDLGIDCAYLVHFSQERVNLQARCLGIGHASRVSQSRAKHLAILNQQICPQDRFYAGSLCGFVKLNQTKKIIEIGECNRWHTHFRNLFGQRLNAY